MGYPERLEDFSFEVPRRNNRPDYYLSRRGPEPFWASAGLTEGADAGRPAACFESP